VATALKCWNLKTGNYRQRINAMISIAGRIHGTTRGLLYTGHRAAREVRNGHPKARARAGNRGTYSHSGIPARERGKDK
jgi:hypothetical protein